MTVSLSAQGFWRKATNCKVAFDEVRLLLMLADAGIASLVYLTLVYLVVKQMAILQTPATLSRVASWTIIAQCVLDAFAFSAVSLVGSIVLIQLTVAVAAFHVCSRGG